MANTYDVGDVVVWSVVFTDSGGNDVDPTTVTFKYQDPSENETSVTPTKDSTGHYHHNVTIDESGIWYGRFEGTGTNIAASEN